jgi:hemoglobin/transferrin/lactoferrin receptor protein
VSLFWKLFFTISFFISSNLYGQTITVVNETGEAVEGVYIYSKNNQKGTITDKKGKADLSIFADDEVLYFSHIQYKSYHLGKKDAVENGVHLSIQDYTYDPIIFNHPLRYNVDVDDEASQIEKISREVVKIENPPTSADMLQNTGNVLVQKSQGGGGSPIIRGFEANKLLLVIDGVKMNNAIYRSGHLQNSLTIDNAILDHTEIIFGPSSSLYGSDALGGVIHFHTRDPEILEDDTLRFSGSSYMRYNSNNNGLSAHIDFTISKKKWGVLTSITASQFGDIIMGKNRMLHGDSLWGLQPNLVSSNGFLDTMIDNPNQNEQVGTAYAQIDFLEKFKYKFSNQVALTVNLQYSRSSDINRYDKLTEMNGGNLKFSEWYYGPQNRLLAQFKLDFNRKPNFTEGKKGIYNTGTLSLAYQRIDEDRILRRFKSNDRIYRQEDLNIYSLNLDFNKVFTKSRVLFYGLEAQHNLVNSSATSKNLISLGSTDAQSRYPGTSNYLSTGLYVEYKRKYKNQASFTSGIRYSVVYAKSIFEDTSFISLPFNTVNILTSAPSANIGLVLRPDSVTRIRMQGTTGFRAPNIDDYGKVFEKKGITVVPNDNLKPEYAFGADFSAQRDLFNGFLSLGASIYGTFLYNAMVQRDFQLNGQDSILYEGEMTKIQAIQNTDNAIIYGTSAWVKLQLSKGLDFNFTYNFTRGQDLSSKVPLEHIPPQFGKIALSYNNDRLNTSIYTFYNFRKRGIDYAPGGDNIDLSPNGGGIPAWWTLNYRVSYTFWDLLSIQGSVENILDVHYRQFASGISQPGRTFMASVKVEF